MGYFDSERNLICQALNMWANWIETGDVCMSAVDAENIRKSFNALSAEKHELIARLRKLSTNILDSSYRLKE